MGGVLRFVLISMIIIFAVLFGDVNGRKNAHFKPLNTEASVENYKHVFSLYSCFSLHISRVKFPKMPLHMSLPPLSSQISLQFTQPSSAKYSPPSPRYTPPLPGVSQSPPLSAKLFSRQDLRSPKVKVKTRCLLVTVVVLIILYPPL